MADTISIPSESYITTREWATLAPRLHAGVNTPHTKIKIADILLDCKTVVFGCVRKARSAVSVILECEAREPHTPASLTIPPRRFFTRSIHFVRIWSRRSRSQKIRLFCSLTFCLLLQNTSLQCQK